MEIKRVNISDFAKTLKEIGVEDVGVKIMAKKMNLNFLYIKNIPTPAANILKQDSLSIGAELALPKHAINYKQELLNGLLIGSDKHLEILSKKELAQPFGLKDLAKELSLFLKESKKSYPLEIMGVINANSESFFEESRFLGKDAILKIEEIIKDGASIVDIGGTSSSPGSKISTPDEELKRVAPIIEEIHKKELYKDAKFSIDTYHSEVASYAMDRGFEYINDITGLGSEEMCRVAAKSRAKVIIMHMQGEPSTMQENPTYDDVILDIEKFFKERISRAKDFGIEDITLDVGIGFGKRLEHNLELIRELSHFKKFGLPLLVGASRKSMIDKIYPSTPEQRLPGSIALHLESIRNGANIIRTHDVKEHKQAIDIYSVLK